MWTVEEIRDKLAELRGHGAGGTVSLLGTLTDIDPGTRTCTLDDDGTAYYDVRLQAVTGGGKGLLLLPAPGAQGLAVRVEDTDNWALIACSEIDKVELLINTENVGAIAKDLLKAIRAMKFTTSAGPTIALVNDPQFIAIEQRLNKIFV